MKKKDLQGGGGKAQKGKADQIKVNRRGKGKCSGRTKDAQNHRVLKGGLMEVLRTLSRSKVTGKKAKTT